MGRAKIKKKSTFIDMTAMSDVTVLLLGETRLGDIIHNKVDYSTYNIGAYGGNWKRHRYVSGGDEKYVEEEGYVQREITTDDSENNAQLETLYSYSKGTLYTREEESEVWNQTEKNNNLPVVSFGTFERIKLDGKTYMTFCVRDDLDLIEYDIIPDNKFTENKTVVYDDILIDRRLMRVQ